MIKLSDGDQLAALLPLSISGDPAMRAAADALSPLLRKTALAVPNLLIFGRMGNQSSEEMIASLGRLTSARGGLDKPSTELLEQLAWQFHVDFRETAATDEQLAAMILQSIPWHRIKGTPASMKAAFALFGMYAVIEEDGIGDYWATYQLGLPVIADMDDVRLVCAVANEMQPARCSLFRIYTDAWDMRPGVYDSGKYDDVLYDGYSGIRVPDMPGVNGDLVVSFGRINSAQSASVLSVLTVGHLRKRGTVVPRLGVMRYDEARYDGANYPRNNGFTRSSLHTSVFGERVFKRYGWSGAWDNRFWAGEVVAVGPRCDPFCFARHSISRVQAVYDACVYDDVNTRYSKPVFALVDNPPRYDSAVYDQHDMGRRIVIVDEVFTRGRTATSNENLLPEDASGQTLLTRQE